MVLAWKEKANLTLLVVDDMVHVRTVIREMLHRLGYLNVTEAEDGIAAWDKLTTQKIDVAIVDWNMPRMNGIDLLKKTRADKKLADIPFIIISGEVGDDTIAEAAETEVDAYIIKPFIAATLDDKISKLLRRDQNPNPVDILLKEACVSTESREFPRAMNELKTAMALYPREPRLTLALAKLYQEMGLYEEAEKTYKKTIHQETKFVKAYDGLADLYRIIGDEKKLLRTLTEALSHSPRNAFRQTELGKVQLEADSMEAAQKSFGAALKAEPNNTVLQHQIGEILMAKGMPKEAVTFFKAASRAKPEDIHTYNRLGIAYREQGQYEEAFEEYKKALHVAPNDENLYYNLGRGYFEAGLKEEALAQFRKAMQLNPAFEAAREMMELIEKDDKIKVIAKLVR